MGLTFEQAKKLAELEDREQAAKQQAISTQFTPEQEARLAELEGREQSFKAGIGRGEVPTGEVSTITGKQITRTDPFAPPTPGFWTTAKAALVRDPETKKKIYSEARGVPLDRYGVIDGEVVYRDEHGSLRSETEFELPTDKLFNFIGETAGDPSTVGATIGTAAGPKGTIIGGIAGETVRQAIAGIYFDDPQTAKGNLANLGLASLFSVLDALTAKGGTSSAKAMLNRGKRGARTLEKHLASDVIDFDAARQTREMGRKFGIDLNLPEATKSRQLIGKYNLLRDLPETANIIEAKDILKNEQIQSAIPRFLNSIAPVDSAINVGRKTRDVAQRAIQNIDNRRKPLVSPLYEAAFSEKKAVNIEPVLGYINQRMKVAKAEVYDNLVGLKKTLQKPDLPKKEAAGKIINPKTGRPFKAEKELFDTSLEGLNDAKKSFDGMLFRNKGKYGNQSAQAKDTAEVRRLLLGEMDGVSDAYQSARAMHALLIPDAQRAKEGLLGTLAGIKEKNLSGATSLLLSSKYTTPELTTSLKREIMKLPDGEKVWAKATRNFLENSFENIKTELKGGRIRNVGAIFAENIAGNKRQRDILRNALGEQPYKNMMDFFDVLKRTGLTFTEEVVSVPKGEARRSLKQTSFLREAAKVPAYPLLTWKKMILDWSNKVSIGKGIKEFADIIYDETAFQQLQTLKKLKGEKLIQGLVVFIGGSTRREAGEELKGIGPDEIPE